MIILLGLVILAAAVIAGAAGVLGNSGSGHALSHGFAVTGYHVTGSGQPRAAAAGTGCACPGAGPHPGRRQASTRNRGTASPPPRLLPVHPPRQMTH
jgi:hypothetical protein